MATPQIKYRSGYKYQLAKDYPILIPITTKKSITTKFVDLDNSGNLLIRQGYAWDGPSGLTIDTKNFMRGSLVHDALYQLMRQEHLLKVKWRKDADLLLKKLCRQDGMSSIRAWWVYWSVRIGGDVSADPSARKKIETAP